ncbi:uncharacterized protein CTRU02_203971 [Colletotrichum truncatum]|uniref:Uncharacterized protein n=1 Tax=Colletotrichum truncatum TaxID=5467 RepID=A0ACC3ZBD1_COLTU
MLAENPNFALKIIDPTGNHTKTGEPEGFINNELQSRGFIIRTNETTTATGATSSATSSATPTTTGSASSGGSIGLSGGAVAGIAIGCVAAGALIMLAIWFIWLRKRRSGNSEANLVSGHHPTPTLHPVMHQDMRQDSAYASPNSSGDRMFEIQNTHRAHLSHQTSNVSPVSPMRRHTPPPSYPSPVDDYVPPMTELSGVREPQEVPSTNPNYPPELAGSHHH